MNVFDIVGPVMVGPSSSHTAGPVRIGNVARKILGAEPIEIAVKFHGSFAKTYAGHGSDRAIIGGMLGFLPDDSRIRDSLKIAAERGIAFKFETVELANAHPNTLIVEALEATGGKVFVLGESVGGGNIIIRQINNTLVEFTGQYDTLVIAHHDAPGAISLVTNLLSIRQINIASMKMYRSHKGGEAIMIIETDGLLDQGLAQYISALPNVTKTTILRGLNQG